MPEFHTQQVPSVRKDQPPYNSVGCLVTYFNGTEGRSSAVVVHPSGILTCAHAFFDEGVEARSAWFFPMWNGTGYPKAPDRDGHGWQVERWYISKKYDRTLQNSEYDVAVCRLKRHKGETVGSKSPPLHPIPVEWVTDKEKQWMHLGYPMGASQVGLPPAFQVGCMYRCDGKSAGTLGSEEAKTLLMFGNMVKGSSGGPWLWKRESDATYFVIGIQSKIELKTNGAGICGPNVQMGAAIARWVDEQFKQAFGR